MGYYQDFNRMTTKKDIGLAIRTFRKKAGIETQEELGKKLNKRVSKGTINRIEKGRGNYNIDTLFRIAEVLNCDVSDFFGVKEKSSKVTMIETLLEDLREDVRRELIAKYESDKSK